MAGADLALIITAIGAILSALTSYYLNRYKSKGEHTVAVRSAALVEMEASLRSRAEDYNRILDEVKALRAEVKTLHGDIARLMQENRELRAKHMDWEPVQ